MTNRECGNRRGLDRRLALVLGLGVGVGVWLGAGGGVAAAEPAADAPVELKVKWPVGQRYLQRITTSQEQQITAAGLPDPIKQQVSQSQDVSLTVVREREDGGRELELAFPAAKMEVTMGGQVILGFDSKSDPAKDSENQWAPMFRKLTQIRLKLLTDRKGAVEKLEGLKEFAEKLGSEAPPQVQAMFQAMLNEDSVKHMGALPEGLPDKPVKIGERWPVKQEMALGPLGKITVTMQFTFKGWEDRENRRCAVLDYVGTITSGAGAGGGQMPMTITGGDTKGRTLFDPELGMTVESTAVQKLAMKVSAMGQDMNIQMTQNITNRLVEVSKVGK